MSDEPSRVDEAWFSSLHEPYRCGHYDEVAFADPVVIDRLGEDVAYNFTNRGPYEYLRDDLLAELEPHANKELILGRLSDGDGTPLRGLHTVRSNATVWMRGDKKSYCFRCRTCKQLMYSPLGGWYILSSEIPDRPIFMSHYGGLIVREGLCKRVKSQKWKKLKIQPLKVLDQPIDGFPACLENLTQNGRSPGSYRRDALPLVAGVLVTLRTR
jgi:hypothetical protein